MSLAPALVVEGWEAVATEAAALAVLESAVPEKVVGASVVEVSVAVEMAGSTLSLEPAVLEPV